MSQPEHLTLSARSKVHQLLCALVRAPEHLNFEQREKALAVLEDDREAAALTKAVAVTPASTDNPFNL